MDEVDYHKSCSATNTTTWLAIHGDRQKLSLEHGIAENLWWTGKAISNKYVFNFLRKVSKFQKV